MSAGNLEWEAFFKDGGLTAGSGEWSVSVSSLEAGTTYYYQAVIEVGGKEYRGEVRSFKTLAAQQEQQAGWLELPAMSSRTNCVQGHFGSGKTRNYTYFYDKDNYAPLWEAYPLTAGHLNGGNNSANWTFNPNVDQSSQIHVQSGSYESTYGVSGYTRGHVIPAADRTHTAQARKEVYYLTNQVPQNGDMNNQVWKSLEEAVRALTTKADTVYVVTGASFRKVGGSENITYLENSSATPEKVPVPNYLWKVVLKVKRTGGTVTSASTVGFWMENRGYTDGFAAHAVSVDQIEAWTGFDFFANLPDDLESSAEANTSWSGFQGF